jgi:nicotinate-nucleotide pyrophosphorylase (carboxylating)
MAKKILEIALMEDIGSGDITTAFTVDPKQTAQAAVRSRKEMVLSGSEIFLQAFKSVDPAIQLTMKASDGDELKAGSEICRIQGLAAPILTAERVALNFLGHLSGIATLTRSFVKLVGPDGPKLLDTRNTTPALRVLEKQAVVDGGGRNHRFCLSDGVLIKDNHIQAAGSIEKAIALARLQAPHTLKIEVEVDDLTQLKTALIHKADIVLLDNMPAEMLRQAVAMADVFFAPNPRTVILEASGGVNVNTIASIAKTGVDYISIGALTHSAPSADVGLDWLFEKAS